MKLEHLLLGLVIEKPSTGYDIRKYLNTYGRFLRSNTTMSQVYRSLRRMTDLGWVAFSIDDRPGAQDAKVYRITPEGRTVFLDWLTGPYTPPSRFKDTDFEARLAFAGHMTREQLVEILDTELNARRDQVARFRFRDRTRDTVDSDHFDRDLAEAVGERLHAWGTRQIDAHIADVARLRDDILDGRLAAPEVPASEPVRSQEAR